MAQLTETKDGVSAFKIDPRPGAPFPTKMFNDIARFLWRKCKVSVRLRLAFDAEWNDTHPHVLTLAVADRVVGVMQFKDATYAKQAYDTMDKTLGQLEKWVRRVAFVRFWGYQVLSFAAVATFVWFVITLVS